MSEMKCKRCGADENRIDGFCSIECRDAFDYEEEIAELQDANTELHSRIAELEAERRWIPVTERLPEFGDVVLVCDSKGYVNKDFRYEADGKWKLTDFVRHWMPLPEPPEVQE